MANIRKIVSEFRSRLEILYSSNLVNVILFGSQSRGDADRGSDIDVMVVLKGDVIPGKEIRRTSSIVAELSLQYDVLVSCVFVSSEIFLSENSPLLINIRREGISL